MKTWPVQDAKARFSQLLDECVTTGPQFVSKRGTVTAVLVPLAAWEQLQGRPALTAYDLLTSDAFFRGEMDIPPRAKRKHRKPPAF
jgi:prevent-host-death family protein